MTVDTANAQRLKALFFSVDRSGGADSCWLWQGTLTQDGYPSPVKYDGTYWRVHVLIYSLTHAGTPQRELVSQRCNNRRCVNPSHLFALEQASAPTPLSAPSVPSAPNHIARSAPRPYPWSAPRKLTDEQRQAMREAYRQGATQAALARQYDVSPSTVQHVVRGVRATYDPNAPRKVYGEMETAIREAYRQGVSAEAIARQYNISPGTVSRIARDARPPYDRSAPRKRTKVTATQEAEIVGLYAQGYRKDVIAKRYGIGQETVRRIVRAHRYDAIAEESA